MSTAASISITVTTSTGNMDLSIGITTCITVAPLASDERAVTGVAIILAAARAGGREVASRRSSRRGPRGRG